QKSTPNKAASRNPSPPPLFGEANAHIFLRKFRQGRLTSHASPCHLNNSSAPAVSILEETGWMERRESADESNARFCYLELLCG
ncbi:MAG: hypothetical protein AAGI38_14085, partial [Bacteroidota bacterium]